VSTSSNVPAGRFALIGSERDVPANAVAAGAPDPSERTSVTVVLRSRKSSSQDAAQALAGVPPSERRYMTREEFAADCGADPADAAAVQRFALDAGLLVVETSLPRRSVVLEGTVAALGAAFGAELVLFRSGDATFRGRTGTLTLPSGLEGVVTGVFGLDERPQARTQFRPSAAAALSYTPPQVAQAYDYPAGLDGAGQAIALIELGGGYKHKDVTTYFARLGITAPKVTAVGVDGAKNAPAGSPDSADGEVLLDIEVAGSIAPGAHIVVYFAPNTDQGFLDAITTAIHDTTNKPNAISISWGGPESTWTAQAMTNFDTAFADAAALGITVTVAAGDNGSSDGVTDGLAHVDFPASSPHVLACGGTALTASGTTIASETTWNDGSSGGATGGGISDVFALPAWQQNAGVPPSVNPGGRIGRGVPDVAGDASPETGYQVLVDGQSTVFGGTSAVAPLWAALVALLNQALGKPVGFLNSFLYAQGEGPFHDITAGNNGAYAAGPGWDACTGLGSPNGAKVLAALASS
jgi:kumamolisin